MLPQFLRFLSCLFALCGPKLVLTCIHASLFLLLRSVFNDSNASALIQTNLWHGCCFLFGSFFVYIADKKCGHPSICFVSMFLIFIGILLTFISVHSFEQQQSASSAYIGVYYFGIYLIAIAFGGAVPSGMVIANNEFLDKVIYKKPMTKWIFFAVSICALSSYTFIAYSTQKHHFCDSFVIVLSIYAFMFCIFALSYNHFNKTQKFKGSCNIFRVIKELFHCSKQHLNEFNVRDYVSFAGRLTAQNIGYKLSVNCVRNLVPFLFTNFIFSCIYWQQLSLIYAQACQMKISIVQNFDFPISALCAIPILFVIVFNDIFAKCFYPFTSRICKFEWTDLKKQGCGLFVTMLSMLYVALIEVIRKKKKKLLDEVSICNEEVKVSNFSIFWLVPCFLLFGIAELMFVVSSNSFYFSQSPPSMKSVVEAIRSFFNAFGNLFAALFVFIVQKESDNKWITDDLNKGHLEYVYLILAGIAFIFFIYFLIIASKYEYNAPMEDERIVQTHYDSADDKTYLTPTVMTTSKHIKIPIASKTERKRQEYSYSTTQLAFGSIQ